jgi:hypothetical protein
MPRREPRAPIATWRRAAALVAVTSCAACGGEQVPVAVVDIPLQARPSASAAAEPVPERARRQPKPKAVADDSIGIPECDAYFAAVRRCFHKQPAVQDAVREVIEKVRAAGREVVQNEATREGLRNGCTAATEALESSCK